MMADFTSGDDEPAGWRVALAELLALTLWIATLLALLVFAYGLAG
jgi:hypothetical protein